MAQGSFDHGLHSHCVVGLCEEPGNPKPWTNLVTPSSQYSHGPSELFVSLSLSLFPPGPGSDVSHGDHRESQQAGSGERGAW